MSENLDLVRSMYAPMERGDFSSLEWAHPGMELVILDTPEAGRWSGLAAVAEYWREWLRAWDSYSTEVDEYRELDGERVLVFGRMSGRGRATGASVEARFVNVVRVREGKIIQVIMYPNRERALADLGLKE